ncbi:unnamed protein product [Prorocentrum cordatum]|uniref:Uncharacterized protein n=1 Tax=Prorocentrum cordatum TaxID=2364126 RepID=A0ABN9UNM1_9DINO|nr:unnamed protein product [Polarella glacialis]
MELRLVTGKCIKRKRVSTQGREREGGGMGARKSAVRRLDCMPSRPRGCGWSAFAAPNAPMHTTRRKRERERESEAADDCDVARRRTSRAEEEEGLFGGHGDGEQGQDV